MERAGHKPDSDTVRAWSKFKTAWAKRKVSKNQRKRWVFVVIANGAVLCEGEFTLHSSLKKRREQLSSFSSSKLGAGIGLLSQSGATHVALFSNICSHFSIHVFVPPSIFTEVSLYEPVRMDSAEQNDWVSFCERGWFPLLHYQFGQNPQKKKRTTFVILFF